MSTLRTHTTMSFVSSIHSLALALLAVGCIGKDTTSDEQDMTKCLEMGNICTLAGTGSVGYNGEGREALDTNLAMPSAVVIGSDGLLLINDSANYLVRQLRADSILKTVAGNRNPDSAQLEGSAHDSGLNNITDMAMGPGGEIYLVESEGPRILELDLSRGEPYLRVVVGAETEFVDQDIDPSLWPPVVVDMGKPYGIAVSSSGRMYVSDLDKEFVWTFDISSGSGQPLYGADEDGFTNGWFSQPRRMAIQDGNLYVADSGLHSICEINIAEGTASWIVGTGAAGFNGESGVPMAEALLDTPHGVSFSPDGRMMISDSGNDAIRIENADGTLETVVGLAPTGYAGDEGPALNASLNFPTDVKMGADGQVFISDANNAAIRWVANPLF